MAPPLTRRQLLRADPLGRRAAPRPPWAVPAFHDLCTRCGDCLPACPERILVVGDGGFPQVDFRRGECTFCADCVAACRPAALHRSTPDTPPWTLVASIAPECLEARGVQCRACIDPCPAAAVTLRPGQRLPTVDRDACTGCGACVAPCPVDAVRVGLPPSSPKEVAA